jgi:hypothetical protein
MRWSAEGAHHLLQTRTTALNGDLRERFERWYPALSGETNDSNTNASVKMAA